MVDLKRKYFFTLFFLCSIFLIYFYGLFNDRIEHKFFHENYILFSTSSYNRNGCQLPIHINPFDDTVRKFMYDTPSYIKCQLSNKLLNNLTYIQYINGFGHLKLIPNKLQLKCYYQLFEKSNSSDNVIVYKEPRLLDPINGVQLNETFFANVSCFSDQKQIYKNFHYVIPKMMTKSKDSKNQIRNSIDNKQTDPSVLILVVESLSRLNYLRFMPKTQHSLERLGRITYLKGLTKLADNSFPNMVPFLTGKRVYVGEYQNESSGPYDDWPFIWKKFQSKGYATALIEDHPDFTLFNYESQGFVKKSPTLFYPRPFWLHMYRNYDTSDYCFDKTIPKIEVMFDQIRSFIEFNRKSFQPYFGFSFYIEVTHDDFNKAQLVDFHISQFIQSISKSLNNTIFILMGDHGNRYGPILETVIGRIEERMPLFAIHLPKLLDNKYPHLQYFLQENSEKLITWLDLHQLLLDIVEGDFSPLTNNKSRNNSHVFSPWRELIPSKRSCKEALIPDNYCVCDERKKVSTNHVLALEASDELIKYLNELLPTSLCHRLTLKSIQNAEIILPSESTAKRKGFEQKIEITIKVNPSDAILRGQLFRTAWSPQWSVRNDVTRLNRYANQSDCVHERVLKKICYCLSIQSYSKPD